MTNRNYLNSFLILGTILGTSLFSLPGYGMDSGEQDMPSNNSVSVKPEGSSFEELQEKALLKKKQVGFYRQARESFVRQQHLYQEKSGILSSSRGRRLHDIEREIRETNTEIYSLWKRVIGTEEVILPWNMSPGTLAETTLAAEERWADEILAQTKTSSDPANNNNIAEGARYSSLSSEQTDKNAPHLLPATVLFLKKNPDAYEVKLYQKVTKTKDPEALVLLCGIGVDPATTGSGDEMGVRASRLLDQLLDDGTIEKNPHHQASNPTSFYRLKW